MQDVRAFLEANTLTVFGMPFETIDMAEVIPQTGVRDQVRAATAAAADGDLTDAMGLLAEAYDELFGIAPGSTVPSRIARFGDTIKPTAERDLVAALQPAPGDRTRSPVGADPRRLASAITDLMKATRDMQLAMRVMALGIDFRQFARFTQLMPSIGYYADGHSERHTPPGYAPTSTDFEFCRQFVITAALRIAEEREGPSSRPKRPEASARPSAVDTGVQVRTNVGGLSGLWRASHSGHRSHAGTA